MSDQDLYKHVIWLQRWEAGKFVEWLQVGRSRVEVGPDGNVRTYSRQTLITIGGWNGMTCTLPAGEKPKDPEAAPQRPGHRSGHHSDD